MSPSVLVLGMPRCGTQSIAGALQILGYPNIYHMREVGKNNHQNQWIALLDAQYSHSPNTRRDISRDELEALLSNYDATADFPSSLFPEALISAYPSAKIILAVRSDENKWFDSMMSTLWRDYTSPEDPARLDPGKNPMRALAERYHGYGWENDFPAKGREFSREYAERVRRLVPGGKLLEYKVQDGWEPLCGFLGKEVPGVGFPREDDWKGYKSGDREMR